MLRTQIYNKNNIIKHDITYNRVRCIIHIDFVFVYNVYYIVSRRTRYNNDIIIVVCVVAYRVS